MKIGVVREIKDQENRVALTPDGARQLVECGHQVFIETSAGAGCGMPDDVYSRYGAEIVSTAEAWDVELVLKIKEPQESEYPHLKDNILFTYLHLAGSSAALTDALILAGTTAIAYETVENVDGRLPLLAPMSAIAGNVAANAGVFYLAGINGGKGVQPGRVMGQAHGKVLVIGHGIVGQHAAHALTAIGSNVTVFGHSRSHFNCMKFADPAQMQFVKSCPENIAEHISNADLVVGAVLSVGAKAPHVVTDAMVRTMQPGSVIVDVSIDQGGCIETSRPTSHSDPVYLCHEVIHYCVTNMPGAYPRTATTAITRVTLPYIRQLAASGLQALKQDQGFAQGLNTCRGRLTCKPVAVALGYLDQYRPVESML